MGNEASMEGGEGGLAGLPAGLAPDGKGGFIQMPAGEEADLSHLSEEERKEIAAAMAKAQSRPPVPQPSGGRVPAGLSKSRTVDAFGEGPPARPKPGRSPSSLSLLESRFRQEPKGPEQSHGGMFSSSFLSGVTSAVSSASTKKFNLFGNDEEEKAKPSSQQSSPKAAPKQAAPAQAPAAKPASPGPASPGKVTPPPAKAGGGLCPLCNTTELNLQAKDQPPNYNTCTGCKQQVCNLCGFSPPDSSGKEWLCLNCQMQRTLGNMEPPASKVQAEKKPPSLSTADLEKRATPPAESPKGSPQISPSKTKQEGGGFFGGFSLGGLTETAKAPVAEAVTGKLFGGFGSSSKPQGGTTAQATESVTGKLFGGFSGQSESAKSSAAASPTSETPSGKMFGFGSSFLSSATSLLTGEESKSPTDSRSSSTPGSPAESQRSSPISFFKTPSSPKSQATDRKSPEAGAVTPSNCPLCKEALNIGSGATPNYSVCTDCKKTVCNLCGFNPMPHVSENEWLCLNCQTQRAVSGKLGDMPLPVSPKLSAKSPSPPPSPESAASSTPASPAPAATAPSPTPSVTSADGKPVVDSAAVQQDGAVLESAQVIPELSEERTLNITSESTAGISVPPEQTVKAATPPPNSIKRYTADVEKENAGQAETVEQTKMCFQEQNGNKNKQEQSQAVKLVESLSEVLLWDNKAELNPARLQITQLTYVKPSTEVITVQNNTNAHPVNSETEQKATVRGAEGSSPLQYSEQESIVKPASYDSMQCSKGNVLDNKDISVADEIATLIRVGENEVGALPIKMPEKTVNIDQTVTGTYEVINEVLPHKGSEAKVETEIPSAKCSENVPHKIEYMVYTRAEKGSLSQKPSCNSPLAEGENDKKITEIASASSGMEEQKQSAENVKVEQKPTLQSIDSTTSTQKSQAPTNSLEESSSASSDKLINFELKAKHISQQLPLETAQNTSMETLSTSLSILEMFASNPPKETDFMVKDTESMPQTLEGFTPTVNVDGEFRSEPSATKEKNVQILKSVLKPVTEENSENRNKPSSQFTGKKEKNKPEKLSGIHQDLPQVNQLKHKSEQRLLSASISDTKYGGRDSQDKTMESVTDTIKIMNEYIVEKDTISENVPEQSISPQRTPSPFPIVGKMDRKSEREIKSNGKHLVQLTQKIETTTPMCLRENEIFGDGLVVNSNSVTSKQKLNTKSNAEIVVCTYPVVEPSPPQFVDNKQGPNTCFVEVQPPDIQRTKEDGPKSLITLKEIDELREKKEGELLKQPGAEQACSPTSPSDISKLENTVLPILEAQTTPSKDETMNTGSLPEQGKQIEIQDSSDGAKNLGRESPGVADEESIRKQIMEMSVDKAASPSNEQKGPNLNNDTSVAENGTGIRHFKTIELNSVAAVKPASDDGEPESLTDSPDDRSRGEGSSSLHASSFTPGTSPTSLSSLDEDSDSSSPSHIRSSGEGKQHRKAKHRQPGQMLPTIEDSSEEEELREEEELLKEQEKQKSSGKKSKKDKEEIRAQRRRERPKTPPSNLSPIEDASPTEELRQEAEMEEFRRSSCSDFSPSMESDTEGFQILPEKIAAVQEGYQLPTSVSLYSPTDEQHADNQSKEMKEKPLKTADEAYEEIMLRAKSPTTVINEQKEKTQKSPDEDMIQKTNLKDETPKPDTTSTSATGQFGKDGKPLLNAEEAYEELMKKQKGVLTPGTSPTQSTPDLNNTAQEIKGTPVTKTENAPQGRVRPVIPDLTVTQCSSGEEESGEESILSQKQGTASTSTHTPATESKKISTTEVVDLSKSSDFAPVDGSHTPVPSVISRPSAPVSPLPTVPQYTPTVPSVVSAAPPVPPKPTVLRRAQDTADIPIPPPLPPPTLPKPTGYPRMIPPHVPQRTVPVGMPATPPCTYMRQPIALLNKPHIPPPVPPKPSSIPAGLTFSHRIGETVKPPIAPKPMSSAQLPSSYAPTRPNILHTGSIHGALNLSQTAESKSGTTSPIRSPTSPRFGKSLHDTYVVITLPSQPGSPVDGVTTQALISIGPTSPRVPLAFTHITETIENPEISHSEKVVKVVQRTTVSVVQERPPPPSPTGRGVSEHEVVDLRTPKVDPETIMKGMDLTSSESRQHCFLAGASGRQHSAIQSSVMNLSIDTSSVPDDISIYNCADTKAYSNNDLSQATSIPFSFATAKSFEPISQIIYHPIGTQAENPINLSTTGCKTHSVPVTIPPTVARNGISTIPHQQEIRVCGAVDLTTVKPVQTMVSVDGSTSEAVTAVMAEDEGKPVDLTAGRRAVCCDVVYKLPFAGSCATTQQPSAPLPEDRFGYRDDHYQYDRSPYGMRGLGGIKPSMSDTNLAEAGLFLYKSKNSYDYNGAMEGAVDLTSGLHRTHCAVAGEAVDYSSKATAVPHYSQARITSAVGTHFGVSSVLRSSNGVVYSSVAAPVPSTYAITTQPGSIFSTTYNTLSSMHTSDTMPSLSNLQNQPLTRSQSFLSMIDVNTIDNQCIMPLNLETGLSEDIFSAGLSEVVPTITTVAPMDYTDASLEAIAASLEALSSPMVPGDEQYQMERERLELEKIKQQRLAEELEWERQEIQRFREQEQLMVQKELEELQAMKQHLLCQQEEERQAHLMMQKETYAQQQEQLEQIQRLQEQLRQQLEEQKYSQMYPDETHEQTHILVVGTDRRMDSGCQTDEEDNTDSAYSAGRKKKSAKKSVDSCVQTDDEDQDEWEGPARSRRSRPRVCKYSTNEKGGVSVQALTEISVQTDSSGTLRGHTVQLDTRVDYPDSDRTKVRPTPLEINQTLKADTSTLKVDPAPPKSPKVLYSPISPCMSPSKSLEFVSYEKPLGDTSPQQIHAADLSRVPPGSPRAPKVIQRSMSDPKPMSPTAEERAATNFQYSEGYSGKGSPSGTPSGTQKKVKRTLPNPPSEEEAANTSQAAYSTASARRRLCRSSNMARAKILQDIDRELDLVERESSKLRKKQAELDEEEKEIDAKLRYLEMGINRRKDALLKEREKRERAYLQSVAEDRDYMSDSEVNNIRETRRGGGGEEVVGGHGRERPRTAPLSELDEFVPPQTKHEYGKYSQYQYPQYQQSLYQSQQPYQSQSIYSSVPSLTASQQQSYHQMLLLQQKARQQAALLSELDATKVSTNYDTSSYLGGKYGNHLDLRSLEDRGGSIAGSPMSNVSADSFYADLEQHHQTSRSYLLLEDAADIGKSTTGLASTTYGIAERELAKAERLLRRTAADVGTDYLGTSSRLHSYGKSQDDEDPMEEPYELKLLKQQLKQEFRRSTGGTESLEQLASLSHHYTSNTAVTSGGYRAYPKTEKYSISRLTLEKQAAKQLPASVLYQKHKSTSNIGKYSSIQDSRGVETDYSSYLGSSGASPRSSRLLQDEITFGLRKNIAEQQKYLGSTLGANLAGSLNLNTGVRSSLGEDSVYPSGSRSRPSSRPSSVYGLDLSIKRDTSSTSLRLKGEGDPSSETSAYQTPSGRTKPTSLPIGQGGRGRIPIVAQNSEEESPLSPVGQPMGMARASAGPLPPISADSRDQFGSCLSLQDPQQQQLREDPARGRSYMLMDDLQGTMSDSEALSDSLVGLNRDDQGNTHENVTDAYHLRQEETDWFDKPRDDGQVLDMRQTKSQHYPFPYVRVKLQRDPKDRSVSGNGLGIRVVGGKEVPGSNAEIGAYVAKVLPGGAAEQTGKIVEGMQVLEWNGIPLSSKTYEEVQGLVGQQCGEAEICVRLDLNMLSDSEGSHLDLHDHTKAERVPRSPGIDPKQLAAELQKVSQQQAPSSSAASLMPLDKASGGSSAVPSPGQPGSPSVTKKRHSKTSEAAKVQSHPVTGEIQLQINYDKQLGNLIVHVLQARNLAPRDNNGYSDPFVKVYLLPGRGQVMVVQNASAENKRRSKHAQKTLNPEWNQTVIYKNIHLEQLRKKTLEVSVWDYDKCSSNDFLGEVLIDLSNTAQLDNLPRWLPLKEQSEGEHHRRSHSAQGRQHSAKTSAGHTAKSSGHGSQDSPKSSVIKSRSHGIFPDPAKDTQVPTIEKSHSSPSTSKPSPSEGQARSHGTPRAHGKSGAVRAPLDDTMATAEAAGQQHRLQPTPLAPLSQLCMWPPQPHHLPPPASSSLPTAAAGPHSCTAVDSLCPLPPTPTAAARGARPLDAPKNGRLSMRHHRHTVAGVLTIQRAPSNTPSNAIADSRHLTLRKAMSEERPKLEGVSRSHRSADAPVTAASLDSGLNGSAFSLLEEEGETNAVDSAIFQVPRFGKIPNGTDVIKSLHGESEGKTQVMGEIKIALKKEMKTEGENLVLEILQCRNITYKFKSPDHLPDLYVKLYVVNIATQKRIIKKKTRVCRHDREPSFNETFRFCMNPTGHSIQLFLVSNGGKFVKKTLIGEAYVWLDKVDLRKRVVSWHKLLATTAQIHS